MTSNSCHTGGFPRYFDVLSSFASRHRTATEGEVQGGEEDSRKREPILPLEILPLEDLPTGF